MKNLVAISKNEQILSWEIHKLVAVLSGIFTIIAGLTIFEDFLESRRNNYAFYLNESILFKIIWFLFIPILAGLYKTLKTKRPDGPLITAIFIILPIVVHLTILPFIGVLLTKLFYEGYDLYKFFSYTMSQDFHKLVIVYAVFVLGYKHFTKQYKKAGESRHALDTVIINNGKDNVVVHVKDIVLITSATPYIFIHTENKKYLHSETLKAISAQLEQNIFVQVHKSTVVNILKVVSFKSRLNGDYDLRLKNGDMVRLSRTYSARFKALLSQVPG